MRRPASGHVAELEALQAAGDPDKAVEMAAHHKVPRVYLGTPAPRVDALVARWRADKDLPGRVALAAALWDSDIHEARVAAAKLLTQARLGSGDPLVWAEFLRWVPSFDAFAIADQACKVGARRLVADPSRLDHVEVWVTDPNLWVRRAALVATLPWTKQNHPDLGEQEARDRILGWAATLTTDPDWSIQNAIGLWLHALSRHDPDRVHAFLAGPGSGLKPFARREAMRRLAAV